MGNCCIGNTLKLAKGKFPNNYVYEKDEFICIRHTNGEFQIHKYEINENTLSTINDNLKIS